MSLHLSESNLLFSVTQLCLTLWDPKDCSTPGFPVLHSLLEFTQTHTHPTIWSSVTLFPDLNLSQRQGLSNESVLHTGGQSIGASASVLPMNTQDWFPLGLTGLISLLVWFLLKRLLQHPNLKASTLWCSAFFIYGNSHIHTWLLGKAWFWLTGPLSAKWHICFLILCLGLL